MASSASNPLDLTKVFEEIRSPQWGPALAWRSFVRAMPFLLDQLFGELRTVQEGRAAATIVRFVLAYALVLDREYRRRLTEGGVWTSSPETERALAQLEKQTDVARRQLKSSALLQALFAMLRLGGGAPTQTALALASLIVESLSDRDVLPVWMEALIDDFRALRQSDKPHADPDDLREYLERPLVQPSDDGLRVISRLERAVEKIAPSLTKPLQDDLVPVLVLIDKWSRHSVSLDLIAEVALRRKQRALLETEVRSLESLANDRRRLAILMARLALEDRTHLALAAAPTAAGLREAMSRGNLTTVDIATLEADLERKQPEFTPNEIWLAWIQVAHSSGIDSIRAEVLSWLATPDADG